MADKKIRTNISDIKTKGGSIPESIKPKPPEEAYHALIELAHDMGQAVVMLRDIDSREGVHVFVSNIWSDITGYSRKELLGISFFDLVLPKYKETSLSRHRQKMSGTPVPGKFTLAIRKKDGQEAVIEISSAVSTPDGLPTNIVFIRDVTSIIESEAKAKEYEQQFKTIVKLANDTGEAIVILQDKDGVESKYVFVNEIWPEITGYSQEELLNMSAFDLISPSHSEAARNRLQDVFAGNTFANSFEGAIISKHGNEVPVEHTIAPIQYYGKASAIVLLRDVSKEKKAEQMLVAERNKYQHLFQFSPVGLLEVDWSDKKAFLLKLKAEGVKDIIAFLKDDPRLCATFYSLAKEIRANKALLDIYDTSSFKEYQVFTKRTFFSIPKKLDMEWKDRLGWEAPLEAMVSICEGEKSYQTFQARIITNKGRWKHVYEQFLIAPGCEHDLSSVYFSVIDVTDRVKAECELKEYKEQLEDLVIQRSRKLEQSLARETRLRENLNLKLKQQIGLIHGLIHNLKTPLSSLLSVSEVMLDTVNDDKVKKMALNINHGANLLSININELVSVVQGETGLLQLEISEIDIVEILEELLNLFRYEALRKKQVISLEFKDNLPVIWADRERLKQVVINLLENSMRYTPSGGTITVRVREEGPNVIVSVLDNGHGIAIKDLPYLFEPYYTMSKSSKHCRGLGLGLPLAKKLIELHGGSIWVHNLKKGGTEVIFSIPIKRMVLDS
ncbi:MAG: PAS domain-containing sensor histidine kinase [Dehalococcoidales bacterium]|jgi:PAS domain S-box-containing protein|nr:PAS domain-containing sensor histidine kinase [Dehalococcoidales bacterium]MDX9986188.1 PAS domain-containing sensor histidine kinase [Dehalococcoidales bacterium]